MAVIENKFYNGMDWIIIDAKLFSFPIYSPTVVIWCFVILIILQFSDIILGLLVARKMKIVTSGLGREGMIKKCLIVCLCLLILACVTAIKISGFTSTIYLGIAPIFFLVLFSYFEVVSHFEKLSIIFGNSREGKLFNILSYLTNLLFNLSIEKLKEITEAKLKQRFHNEIGLKKGEEKDININ